MYYIYRYVNREIYIYIYAAVVLWFYGGHTQHQTINHFSCKLEATHLHLHFLFFCFFHTILGLNCTSPPLFFFLGGFGASGFGSSKALLTTKYDMVNGGGHIHPALLSAEQMDAYQCQMVQTLLAAIMPKEDYDCEVLTRGLSRTDYP